MTKQPEALRLADELDAYHMAAHHKQAAAELRRLHEANQAMLGELVDLEIVYETIIHWDEGGGKRSRRELARRIVALYTSPAIEAAHGIKENT